MAEENFINFVAEIAEAEQDEQDFDNLDNLVRNRAPKTYLRDNQNPLEMYDEVTCRKRFRFSKNTVLEVLLPVIGVQPANIRRGLPISPIVQLLIALRFYATGIFQIVGGDLAFLSQGSVTRVVKRVSIRLAERYRTFIKFPTLQGEIAAVRRKFYAMTHFPGVVGCIDGTHIPITNPGGNFAELYRNRKGYMSINVQAVVGPDMEIFDLVCRWPGSTHDSRILDNSVVKTKFEDGRYQGILLGDSGYPQLPYLFTPVLEHAVTTHAQRRYNSAHRSTRNIVERFFGICKRRFSCLQCKLRTKLRTTAAVVIACGVLHNVAILHNDVIDEIELEAQEEEVPLLHDVRVAQRGIAIRNAFIERHFTRNE